MFIPDRLVNGSRRPKKKTAAKFPFSALSMTRLFIDHLVFGTGAFGWLVVLGLWRMKIGPATFSLSATTKPVRIHLCRDRDWTAFALSNSASLLVNIPHSKAFKLFQTLRLHKAKAGSNRSSRSIASLRSNRLGFRTGPGNIQITQVGRLPRR